MSCEVCNQRPSIGVVASCYGPMSFAICQQCLAEGAEPPAVMAFLNEISDGDLACFRPEVGEQAKTFHDERYLNLRDWISAQPRQTT